MTKSEKIIQKRYKETNVDKQRIHICLSPWNLTDDYNRHAGVTLLSILNHCSQQITIHLLYDEKLSFGKDKETKYNKTCYQKIAEKYGAKIEYHHVELPEWIAEFCRVNTWPPGILLRLNLPTILPDIEKIIYLDCDTIVQTDIGKLWDINIDGKYLAATVDQGIYQGTMKWPKSSRKYLLKRKISLSNYFNTGVLILNLCELRKIAFTEKVWEYLKNNLDTPFPDQDAMNYVCQSNFLELEWRYNNINHLKEDNNNCIMHLCGGLKPWCAYTHSYNDIYWDYLKDTPWCEKEHAYESYLRSAPDFSKALSQLEDDFFAYISGTNGEKIRYATYFCLCIFKSFMRGFWNFVIGKR